MRWKTLTTRKFRFVFRLVACFSLLVASGCPQEQGLERGSVVVDNRERAFWLHAPRDLAPTETVPLVIALHPFAGTGPSMAAMTGFNATADAEGFIVCYPEGVTFLWNGDPTDEPGKQLVEDASDVGFIDALLDQLLAECPIDPARLYVVGASNGGLMAQRLACELPERFAAAASVMITLPVGFPERCAPGGPIPMLLMIGSEDPFFPREGGAVQGGPPGGPDYLSVAATVDFWVDTNGSDRPAKTTLLSDRDPGDGTRVIRQIYGPSGAGAPVVFYYVAGGGHTWPGGTPPLLEVLAGVGPVSHDLSATETIWSFFKAHTRVVQ